MNFDIEFLLLEWAYRVDTGMPDVKNPEHINELRTILKETKYPPHFISEFIVNIIREDDIVKNKKSGNTYTVKNHNSETQDLVTKDASEEELAKVKDKTDGDKEDKKDDPEVNIFDKDKEDDTEAEPETGLSDKENKAIAATIAKYNEDSLKDQLGNPSKENLNIANSFMSDLKSFSENPSKQKAKELVVKFKLTVNKQTADERSKLYVNPLGPDRKFFSGGPKGQGSMAATSISNLIRSMNIDIPNDKGGALPKKTFTGDKVYPNKTSLKIEESDNSLTIAGTKLISYDVDELKSKIGKSLDASNPKLLKVERHNFLLKNYTDAIGDSGELDVLDINPGADLATEEGRISTSKVALDQLSANILQKVNAKESKIVAKEIQQLSQYEGKEFVTKSNELLWKIGRDPELKQNSADITEIVAYAQELKSGNIAYMPADSTFTLGDIIVLPSSQPTLKDIINSKNDIDQMLVTMETQSIKKDAGGASSGEKKVDLSEYHHAGVKKDLQKIIGSFNTIFSEDSKSVDPMIKDLEEKYKDILEKDSVYQIRLKGGKLDGKGRVIKSPEEKIKNTQVRNNKIDFDQHLRYHKLGLMMDSIYNHEVKFQGFTNKKYMNRKSGVTVQKSNGTDNIAYLKFEGDVGFTSGGKPGAKFTSRFVHLND